MDFKSKYFLLNDVSVRCQQTKYEFSKHSKADKALNALNPKRYSLQSDIQRTQWFSSTLKLSSKTILSDTIQTNDFWMYFKSNLYKHNIFD